MNILVAGISHKTAPIEVREKLYLKDAERALLLSALKNDPAVAEAIVLSTCNRTEIYADAVDGMTPEALLRHLLRIKHFGGADDWGRHFYAFQGADAVRHLLRVATGLDSLVLGEKQILGQIKTAVDLSREMGMLGRPFNILSNITVRAGKKAQNETQVGYGGVSVSWAAVTMAQSLLGSFEDKSVLVIGAGKMSKLAANHFANRGIREILVMNRTQEKAALLARQFGGTEVSFWDLKEMLERVDACICAASAPHYLITNELIAGILPKRQGRPLVLMDISMPRNIEPLDQELPGVRLITIDDLDEVTQGSLQRRQEAVRQVEEIVEQKVLEFHNKILKTGPLEIAAGEAFL
ncbi:MAG: glutamyl-tRNA reductase [Candidatus Omnitrophota bacterium]|nr:glutamyl-tRNA reductase [Candidatus Omnitrophota bacterium]MDZ4241236.1 glutamyl-tRNA reductase [Candidatus Omnitrophota bacterium]